MTWIRPVECDYEVLCIPYQYCKRDNTCYSQTEQSGPTSIGHEINTDYSISVAGKEIELVKTTRTFSAKWKRVYSQPTNLYAWRQDSGMSWLSCGQPTDEENSLSVKEDCTIVKSTLHFLDLRYGVCLFKKTTHDIKFDLTSTTMSRFKTSWGEEQKHKLIIREDDWTSTYKEEWILLKDNSFTTIATETGELEVEAYMEGGGKDWHTGFVPDLIDESVRQVLILPQPESKAIPLDDETSWYGFYDYGNEPGEESQVNILDGGCKNFFYPSWCRGLQTDPFWEAAAARRYMVTWWGDSVSTTSQYTPPAILVDPIPIGTYAKHPVVGEVYQFLCGETLKTSPDLTTKINEDLKQGLSCSGTTLYSPISLI